MKKKYEMPNIEINEFDVENTITALTVSATGASLGTVKLTSDDCANKF
jgi:hypothetical protein